MGKRLDGHEPSVRFTNGLTLYFQYKDEILVWDSRSFIKVCRPFYPPKGYYTKNWKPLLERLYHNNNLETVRDVALLAGKYDADVYCPRSSPPEIPQDILVRPSKYFRGDTMGIFKPTDTYNYDIVVYSKYCIQCDEQESTNLIELETWAMHNNLDVKVIRTAYRPADHKRAAEIYDSEDYPTFVVWHDVKTLKEFVKMIKNTSNKLIKPERNKGDMQDMQRAKGPRRKTRVAREGDETKVKNEE